MKQIKVLYNKNKLYSEVSSDVRYSEERDEFSIRFVFNGHEGYKIAKRNFNIYPGNFMVINKDTLYSRKIYSDIPSHTFSILFAAEFLAEFHTSIIKDNAFLLDNPFNATAEVPSFLETIYPFRGHLMFNMLHLKHHFYNDDAEDLLMDEYLHHSLLLFYQLYNQEILAKSSQLNIADQGTRSEVFKRLTLAKDFMLSNYNLPITLDDISSHACISAPHLFRTFKQVFHQSPHQYLIKVRLENARHMLKHTQYSLREIVHIVGFTCASTFIKLFKRQFGFTPRHYRISKAFNVADETVILLN